MRMIPLGAKLWWSLWVPSCSGYSKRNPVTLSLIFAEEQRKYKKHRTFARGKTSICWVYNYLFIAQSHPHGAMIFFPLRLCKLINTVYIIHYIIFPLHFYSHILFFPRVESHLFFLTNWWFFLLENEVKNTPLQHDNHHLLIGNFWPLKKNAKQSWGDQNDSGLMLTSLNLTINSHSILTALRSSQVSCC